jgi:hypothetical protein
MILSFGNQNDSRAICVPEWGRRIWIADAHRGDGNRFIVRADEKLTAFVELEKGDSRVRGEFDRVTARAQT